MTASAIGSLKWAEPSGGLLSASDRRAMLARAVPLQLREWGQTLRRALGLVRAPSPVFDRLSVPDTRLVQLAQAHCAKASPPFLLAHCWRSYFWGALLGELDSVSYDPELFCVSALLHDLGLTPTAASSEHQPCFAISGARAAQMFLLAEGCPAERADLAGDIIGQHCNVDVPASSGPEAGLLRAATAFDVIGQRYRDVSPDDVAQVLLKHPRTGCKSGLIALFANEAKLRPGTRAHFLAQRLQFLGRIRRAPFSE